MLGAALVVKFIDPDLSQELARRFTCNRCGLRNRPGVSEVASRAMDYQSGSEHPHSKGWGLNSVCYIFYAPTNFLKSA